jgi:hypothetical protein
VVSGSGTEIGSFWQDLRARHQERDSEGETPLPDGTSRLTHALLGNSIRLKNNCNRITTIFLEYSDKRLANLFRDGQIDGHEQIRPESPKADEA